MSTWSVQKLSREQPRRYFVARQNDLLQWEQLQHRDGCGIARFESAEDAQAAADAENASATEAAP